ncbi:MAG: hypothetical protein PHV62_09065 [Sulfuricurvum sp.]|nr:hypothetical protein [Sulfuricurvum sp.]
MIRARFRLLLILCFWASVSLANNHVHIDTSEHADCVKCYVHDHMASADASIIEPSIIEYQRSEVIRPFTVKRSQQRFFTSFDARAPPSNS